MDSHNLLLDGLVLGPSFHKIACPILGPKIKIQKNLELS